MPELFDFVVISGEISSDYISNNRGILQEDNWDDWRKYRTQFYLTIVDEEGGQNPIGLVKVGQVGLKPHPNALRIPPGHRKPAIEKQFDELSESFFSVGQDETYYENLARLGDKIRTEVLTRLRDVALNIDIWNRAKSEYVMEESLLRSISVSTVEGQFRRMAHGGARLTRYSFSYLPPRRLGEGDPPFELKFKVEHDLKPPTNVHVLIGPNGIGKTHLLTLMAKALVAPEAAARQSGKFEWKQSGGTGRFANVVSVSFSAFDELELPAEVTSQVDGLNFTYIGLRRSADDTSGRPKSPQMLATEFVKSLANCQIGPRRRRWANALSVLQSDPGFNLADLGELIRNELGDEQVRAGVAKSFSSLSSGHKIVLLTLTRLVEVVEERTLVLIDEPEAHLHPPLLAAFIRALSNLLVDRNGVAVIATHSPVVLQEVPKSCAWLLGGMRGALKAERLSLETFGENVGTLSREVFRLELSKSGYQRLIEEAVSTSTSYDEAVYQFDGQLGAEAKAIVRALIIERQPKEGGT